MDNVHLHDAGLPDAAVTKISRYFVDVVNLPAGTSTRPPLDEAAQKELEKQWIAFLCGNQQTTRSRGLKTADDAQRNDPRPPRANNCVKNAEPVTTNPNVHTYNALRLPTLDALSPERAEPMVPIHPKPREIKNQYFGHAVRQLAMGSHTLDGQTLRNDGWLRSMPPKLPPPRPESWMPSSSRPVVDAQARTLVPVPGTHFAQREVCVQKRREYFHLTFRGCCRCGELLTVVNGLGLTSDCFVCRLRWKFEDQDFEGFKQLKARAMWQRGFAKVMVHVRRQ